MSGRSTPCPQTRDPTRVPPHVVVLIGDDDETVLLSDAAMAERQEVSRSTFETAWTTRRSVGSGTGRSS